MIFGDKSVFRAHHHHWRTELYVLAQVCVCGCECVRERVWERESECVSVFSGAFALSSHPHFVQCVHTHCDDFSSCFHTHDTHMTRCIYACLCKHVLCEMCNTSQAHTDAHTHTRTHCTVIYIYFH